LSEPAARLVRRWWIAGIAALAVIVAAASIALALGRVPICRCGSIKLWHGVVNSAENSQHLTDWYTPSHVIHGMAFYGILWLVARRLSVQSRMVVAVLIEATWEVFENTPFVIDRYRAATIALDYYGDSVLNSMADIAAMLGGFAIARWLPVRATVAAIAVMELAVLLVIRDNLTLNIVMLLHPFEAIKQWQLGPGP